MESVVLISEFRLNELDFDSIPTGRIDLAEDIARRAGFLFLVELRDVYAQTLFSLFTFPSIPPKLLAAPNALR